MKNSKTTFSFIATKNGKKQPISVVIHHDETATDTEINDQFGRYLETQGEVEISNLSIKSNNE